MLGKSQQFELIGNPLLSLLCIRRLAVCRPLVRVPRQQHVGVPHYGTPQQHTTQQAAARPTAAAAAPPVLGVTRLLRQHDSVLAG